ncbi:MAG: hypothetical protein L3J75_16445 [Methylococcaceae bacterium]|nr:hypothetical protein [Methylococcaceae bacterium]
MNKLPEAVTSKFTELFVTLHHATDDLKIAGAEANLMGDFNQVASINELCRKLQALDADIKTTVNNFDANYNNRPVDKGNFRKLNKNRTRKPSRRLRVKIAGQIIEETTIAQTFLKTVRVFGFDKVAKLNMMVTKVPLIARTSVHGGYQTQKLCDGWYVTTHVNKHTATNVLKEKGKQLNIPVKLESIE